MFVMINSISIGSDGSGGEIAVLTGLSFDDGPSAVKKTWDYDSSDLSQDLEKLADDHPAYVGSITGAFGEIVKFRISESGVLKTPDLLDDRIVGVTVGAMKAGPQGTFTLEHSGSGRVADFEADAVLYRPDGSSWAAARPSTGQFNSDGAGATYMFLKTDADEAYDVIIRLTAGS
jgi:hypothetical protein